MFPVIDSNSAGHVLVEDILDKSENEAGLSCGRISYNAEFKVPGHFYWQSDCK